MDKVKGTPRKKQLLELLAIANTLPQKSGCYLMKNKDDQVIYVGKAKRLKSRVTSYFNNSAKSPKTQILVSHINSFEFMITESDAESYVLENNLIKTHRPKYNIRLKDDKSYPYVMVNNNSEFPKLEYVRRPKKKKGHELFGPYPTGSNIGATLRILTKAFSLRDCSDHELKTRTTPCILFQMHQCTAPCVKEIDSTDYKKNLNLAVDFLRGKRKAIKSLKLLKIRMSDLADNESFEQAAMIRDYISELEKFTETSYDQNVEFLDDKNVDIICYYQGESEIDISLYMIRSGALLGHRNFHFSNSDLWDELEEELVQFLLQYYSKKDELLPERIITSLAKENSTLLQAAIEKSIGGNIKFTVESSSKKYASLIESTLNHAKESQRVRIENQDSVYIGLNKLKELLKLKSTPRTLECYDVAVWQGKSPAASQIVYHDGVADKKSYKYYHLAERPEGNNDFAMMQEVFGRRVKHGNLPDVFVVDGGIAQVNAVKKVLDELEIETPVVGIAKAKDLTTGNLRSTEVSKSEERLIIQGRSNPYILNKNPSLFKIIVGMRDEAHRFSRKLHHKAEKKRIIKSWVNDVKGLNEKTKQSILQNLTMSKSEVKRMKIKEIQDFFGLEIRHARVLYNFLHAKNIEN
jgi:excinuclease ABC subunit C